MLRIGFVRCPYCPSLEVYRSQPVTWQDRAWVFLLLQLVRCLVCLRQHYRPLLLPAPESPLSSTKKSAQIAKDENRKRTA
jgi:hypothetical protein